MSPGNGIKLLEVGVLLLALVLFVWWQLRDLERARQATARQRALEAAQADANETEEQAAPDLKTPPP